MNSLKQMHHCQHLVRPILQSVVNLISLHHTPTSFVLFFLSLSFLSFLKLFNAYLDSESYMELDPSEHQRRSNLVRNDNNDENSTHVNETMHTSTAWHLNVEDIDPSVIDELPLEIQREVRGWFRLPKRVQATKRGSDITQYFLSAKK